MEQADEADDDGQAEQIEALLAPNLEHAVMCVESARLIASELGARGNLDPLSGAIEHALHFLHLARGCVTQLQELQELQATAPQIPEQHFAGNVATEVHGTADLRQRGSRE